MLDHPEIEFLAFSLRMPYFKPKSAILDGKWRQSWEANPIFLS